MTRRDFTLFVALFAVSATTLATAAFSEQCLSRTANFAGCGQTACKVTASASEADIESCAIYCSAQAGNHSIDTVAFSMCGQQCECLGKLPFGAKKKSFESKESCQPTSSSSSSSSSSAPQQASGTVQLFAFDNRCPLTMNATVCSSGQSGSSATNCQIQNDCCVYVDPNQNQPAPQISSTYTAMIQWCIIAILILAVLEAFFYGCLRYRRSTRRQQAEDTNNQNQEFLLGEEEAAAATINVPNRSKESAALIAGNLVETFPVVAVASPSPNNNAEDIQDADLCPVCLEPMVHGGTQLNCGHQMHALCLKDFLTHQLQRSNEATCPSCRATILADIQLPQ